MKIKTSEAKGLVLDWLATKASGLHKAEQILAPVQFLKDWDDGKRDYSGGWGRCGLLKERYQIADYPIGTTEAKDGQTWLAQRLVDGKWVSKARGTTPPIAVARCFVLSVLGEEVDVPDELLQS
jgi:hypothetical protein